MSTLSLTMEEPEKSALLDTQFKLKDIVQFVLMLLTGVIFILTMNAKLEALTSAVNELKDNDNKQAIQNDLAIKALQNEVNTQTLQISLIQKDVETLKAGKK